MLRKILSVAAAAAVASVLLTAQPAMASDSEHTAFTDESTSIGDSRFQGGFLHNIENNDWVEVCDNDADGWRVYLDVLVGSTWKYTLGASGVGDCDLARASDGGSHNLPENTTITFFMYLYNGTNGDVTGAVTRKWYNDH